MVRWREVPVDSDVAQSLLTEYFRGREIGFVSGAYQVVFPDPAAFVPPDGVFLVAEDDTAPASQRGVPHRAGPGAAAPIGCGGIRRIAPAPGGAVRFEVKHLYLRPQARGRGQGRLLLEELERRARDFGAEELVLDTHESLVAAGGLYRSAGFRTIEPYNDNPNATTWFAKRIA